MNFRAAPGRILAWHGTEVSSGFSNFLFVDREYRSHSVLRRILSLARVHEYQSLLIEEICEDDCSLLAEENEALAIRRSDFTGSVAHRLSFWRCKPNGFSSPKDFIGYAIFKSDSFSGKSTPDDHVYEAIVPSFRTAVQNNFIHCNREYSVNTQVGIQQVRGVLYAQQNDLTFVCAHVAMRTALSSLLPDMDISYAVMNGLAGIDHKTRIVGTGYKGLGPDDMERILTGLGVHHEKIIHEPNLGLDLPTEFQKDLYGFIESGNPALVGFELDEPSPGPGGSGRHIIPVIGHTFNEDAWVPDAQRAYFGNLLRYFSSESWLSSYVVHDDNFGPYYCLPRHFLKKDNFRIILGLQRHKTSFSAGEAEAVGFDFLRALANVTQVTGVDWYDRFRVFAANHLLVLRSLVVEKDNYIRHLREIRSCLDVPLEESAISRMASILPDRFWMIEASAQELFTANRRKFGEVLISSDLPMPRPLNTSLLIAARLPGLLLFNGSAGIMTETTLLEGHTPLLSSPPLC